MKKASLNSTSADTGEVGIVGWHDFCCKDPFTFENGESIPEFTLRYEAYGERCPAKGNAMLIFHALSGDHHCAGRHLSEDRKPGWWNNIIGPGKPIDTDHFFVVCSNCLGGCQGSTGPASINPETDEPYNLSFPELTVGDMVHAQYKLCKHLGLEKLYAAIGGSMGGMQVLQWAIDYPDFVQRIIPLATTARQSTQAIAFNEVGRSAIIKDPNWEQGSYLEGKGPIVGLSIARMMAHITYLLDKGMEEKFGREKRSLKNSKSQFDVEFEVESYLRYQGLSFVSRFDPNTYLYFTKALDRFDLYSSGSLEETLKAVQAKTLVVGFTSDWLFPPEQNRNIVHALLRCGKNATYAEAEMNLGHDSFLVDAPELYELISSFLAK